MNKIKIPFCKPYVNKKEAKAAYKTILKGWITTGQATQDFEKEFAQYVGSKHCILLTSCTAALFLSLEWLKKNNDIKKVLVPSLTFAATVTEVVNAGLLPVFGDVDKKTMCLKVTEGATMDEYKDIDAVIPVHLCGVRAKTNYGNVKVIEDSAHLIEEGQCRGVNDEHLTCFSFYATKNMTMGEGGAICTNDDKAADWFKQARHHGISKGGWNRYKEGGSWQYDIEFIGWKFNPSDILASVASVNLKKMKKMDKERRRIVALYNEYLGYKRSGLHLYPILVNNRAKFMALMQKAGIQCSVHFLPIHKMTAFKDLNNKELKNTEWLGERLVSLPLFPSLKNNEVKYICQRIKEIKLLLPIESIN